MAKDFEKAIIDKMVENARKIQEEIVDIFDREKVDQIAAYGILTDLTKSFKEYIKAEGIDIDKLKEKHSSSIGSDAVEKNDERGGQ